MLYDHWMIGWTSGSNRHKGAAPGTHFYNHARSFQSGKVVLEQVGVGENTLCPQV